MVLMVLLKPKMVMYLLVEMDKDLLLESLVQLLEHFMPVAEAVAEDATLVELLEEMVEVVPEEVLLELQTPEAVEAVVPEMMIVEMLVELADLVLS